MPEPALRGIRACVFDAYGTLFDVHCAVARHRQRLGPAADAVSADWRRKQLEYTWLRSLMQAHAPFSQVTAEALDWALGQHAPGADAALRQDLLAAYRTLDAYPEVPGLLSRLRQAGLPCLILSNGDPEMLADAVAAAGLAPALDGVLSVEAVGIYKPDPRVYRLACEHLDLPPAAIAFQSANGWDAAGAAHFGFRVAWVNRFGQPAEQLPGRPTVEIPDLRPLPRLLGLTEDEP